MGSRLMVNTMDNLHTTTWITYMLLVGNFWVKKKTSEHINMGSSFEELDATSLTEKTDFQLDRRFEL